ncbi:MAG: metal-dependent transcriptional regulator [Bacteroidetes bacterium]|jgi:DtxR family Mn-dependent transcriptional regulator|nr:metal-dependent transcriptional regulator [Bacteroidota bacterium]
MASENIENYLKNIYKIQEEEGRVATSTLSQRLQVSAASVSEMVRRLAEEGLLRHTPYKGVELTERGRSLALRIVRRHRLWEVFLFKVLKYDWDEVDAEAERLEHMTSERLEERLDAALGHPTHDPHGHAIPTRDGRLVRDRHRLLADAQAGEVLEIRRVSDDSPELLQYAARVGIALGSKVRVLERQSFDGSLRVRIGGEEVVITDRLASRVHVEGSDARRRSS